MSRSNARILNREQPATARTLVFTMSYVFAGVALASPPVERFTVCSIDTYRVSAYPAVERLADGRLICVFSANDKTTGGKLVVAASFSEDHGRNWNPPEILIDSKNEHDYDPNLIVVGPRVIVTSTTVPSDHHDFISTSRTVAVRSEDNGRTWSKPFEIPMGHRYTSGKINNGIVLRDGSVLFGYTYEPQLEKQERLASEGDMIQRSAVLISRDRGLSWESGGECVDDTLKIPDRKAAIRGISEPAIVECSDGSVYMLSRTGMEKLYESRSTDGGRTWSPPVPSALTGHNAPAALTRFGGRRPGILVVWNNSPKDRWPLCVAASFDDARTWTAPREIAMTPGRECSYPGGTQAADGRLIVVWQQQQADGGRQIEGVRLDVEWLLDGQTRPQAFSISEGPKMPAPRGGHAAACLNGDVLVAGGTQWSADRTTKRWLDESLIWRRGEWRQGPSLPHPLAYAAFAADASGVYLAGGTEGDRRFTDTLRLGRLDADAHWSRLAELPTPLSAGGGAMLNGTFFVACGETADGMSNRMWSLRVAEPGARWEPRKPLPGPARAFPSLVACDGHLYLLGGASAWKPLTPLRDAYRYDPAADEWKRLPDLPWPGYAWAACAVGGHDVLLAGRADGTIHPDLWLLDVQTMAARKIGDAVIQTTTAPLVSLGEGRWWLIGGEPDSMHTRTERVTAIKATLP